MKNRNKQGASTLAVLLAVLVAAVFALALTNPTQEAHEKVLYARLAALGREEMKKEGLLGALAASLIDETTVRAFVEKAEYHNYVLFSKMTINGSVVTFGILRNVVVKE